MSIDLHELANLPGYGTADARLTAAGYPKERTATKGDHAWQVEIEYSVSYTATLEIEAATEAEARQIARGQVEAFPGLGSEQDVVIDSTDIDGRRIYG